ncbi:MAG: phage holin family protein [Chloroflexota bacterium]
MTRLLVRLAVSAGAVLLVQWLLQEFAPPDWQVIRVGSWQVAVGFAIVLGLLNAFLRPILLLVTCPFNLITLGLFTFVINALVFWLAARLVSGYGMAVEGFTGALIGSLAVTVCVAIADRYLEDD